MLGAFLQVVLLSVLAAIATEATTYVLLYRKRDYISLRNQAERLSERIEKEKQRELQVVGKNKNIERLEQQLRATITAGSKMAFRSSLAVALCMIAFFRFFSRAYEGVVVARIPFTPWSYIQGVTHRNLPGDDMRECSAIFVYVLCSICVKPTLQKLHGLAIKGRSLPAWLEPPKN